MISRRSMFAGAAALLAAPAIVRASNLMPVRAWAAPNPWVWVATYESLNRAPPLTVEGACLTFDRGGLDRYPTTEPIWRGDIVCIGADGYARRARVHPVGIVGIAMCNSAEPTRVHYA